MAGRETQPRDTEGYQPRRKSIKRKSNKSVEPDLTQKDDTESVENPTDNNPPINPQIEPVSAGVDASGIDVEQLLGYLADPRTVSLSGLRYVLNAKKMDPNNQANATNLARQKMQLVFKNNATLMFNTLQPIGKFQTLFGVQTIQQFLAKVNDVNDSIFNFVITN